MKNLWSKSCKTTEPYATVTYRDWTWKILKAYQSRQAELKNQFARYFCQVITPMTGSYGDMGDVYVKDIPMTAEFQRVLAKRLDEEGEASLK